MTTLNEFDIIEQFFTRQVKNTTRFPAGIGDDAALIAPPPGYELATSVDTLVLGTHFPHSSDPSDIGYKSLAVSLSDLAAMGAEPSAVLLALTLPEVNEHWLKKFAIGFFELAEQYEVELIGGNITRGPLSVSTVTYGWAPAGKALRRSGAKPNDDIYVTGTLGDAGFALQQLQQKQEPLTPELHQRFFRPHPRVRAGLALRHIATAAIDISDGLAADLGKLLKASHVGGHIQTERLPLSPRLRSQCTDEQAAQLALTAGEDYELCFTAAHNSQSAVKEIFSTLDCTAHFLGTTTQALGLNIRDTKGQLVNILTPGYQHF